MSTQEKITKLQNHLDKQTYPYAKYQNIECINFGGLSGSNGSWDNIKDLVDWKDKSVADIGSNHGYFCVKIFKEGASKVVGFEIDEDCVKTARLVADASDAKVDFVQWNGDTATFNETFDVTLCLNVIHYFEDTDLFLQNIKTKQIIFEIDRDFEEVVNKYFNTIEKRESHRMGRYAEDRTFKDLKVKAQKRIILLCEPKE